MEKQKSRPSDRIASLQNRITITDTTAVLFNLTFDYPKVGVVRQAEKK